MNETYEDDYEEIDLMELIMILWRRKWLIALITLLAMGAALGISKLMEPVYEGTALLKLLQPPLFENTYIPRPPTQQEILELFRSASVMQAVHEATGIGESWESVGKALTIEVPSQTQLFTLKAQAKSPDIAKKLLETWIEVGTEKFNEHISRTVQLAYEQLANELENSSKALEQATRDWAEFSKTSQVQILSKRLDSLTSALVEHENSRGDLITKIRAEESRVRTLTEGLTQQQPTITIKQSLLERELPSNTMVTELPAIVETEVVNEIYQDLMTKLVDTRTNLAGLESSLQSIDQLIADTQNAIEETQVSLAAENEIQEKLSMQLDERRNLYNTVRQQYQEAKLAVSLPLQYFERIGEPLAKADPVKPRTLFNVAIAAVLGVFVGVGIALFCEYFEDYKKRQGHNVSKTVTV